MTAETDLIQQQAKEQCFRALTCLYLAADEHVAADVNAKVKAYLDLLATALQQRDERLATVEQERETMQTALKVIHTAARGDEKRQCWAIRKWLDDRDIFNGDIQGADRLIEEVCNAAAFPPPPKVTT
jgi:hypothetical protein